MHLMAVKAPQYISDLLTLQFLGGSQNIGKSAEVVSDRQRAILRVDSESMQQYRNGQEAR